MQVLQKATVAMAGLEAFQGPFPGAYLGHCTAGTLAAFPALSLMRCPAGFGAGEAEGPQGLGAHTCARAGGCTSQHND